MWLTRARWPSNLLRHLRDWYESVSVSSSAGSACKSALRLLLYYTSKPDRALFRYLIIAFFGFFKRSQSVWGLYQYRFEKTKQKRLKRAHFRQMEWVVRACSLLPQVEAALVWGRMRAPPPQTRTLSVWRGRSGRTRLLVLIFTATRPCQA